MPEFMSREEAISLKNKIEKMKILPKDKYSFAAGTINIEINKKYGAISREDHKLYCYFKIEDLLIKG